MDECSDLTHTCDDHALCNNTLGSFDCQCLGGFVGDGYSCDGMEL